MGPDISEEARVALETLRQNPLNTQDLMTLSGHTKTGTLLRYLVYGIQPTVEAEAARAKREPRPVPDPIAAANQPFRYRSQESTRKHLGLAEKDVAELVERISGFVRQMSELPASVKKWPLHLKHNTPLDMEAVLRMRVAHPDVTRRFLLQVQPFMDPRYYSGLRTSRTIKPCALTPEEVARAVEMGKFEPCPATEVPPGATHLPEGVHGVNVFTVPELKGRRRLITEPLLNRVVLKKSVPPVRYDTRLGRRQQLRYARYMLQIDFEAYYDAIPIPEELRCTFVFRTGGGSSSGGGRRTSDKNNSRYYRLRTLPTGARWSVAVGQAVTWTIVDIDTPVTILTLIDNILIAGREGQEAEFVSAVRRVLERIRAANLMTSPDREELASSSDEQLLRLAQEPNVFLGEEYSWTGHERVIRNSVKTVAKLTLALRKTTHTIRSLASLISLIFFALHTTQLNPARAFNLLRAYIGVSRLPFRGYSWDDPVPYIDTGVWTTLREIGDQLIANPWWKISDVRRPSMREEDYDVVVFTDASLEGWGAVAQFRDSPVRGRVVTYRQQWVEDLARSGDGREDGGAVLSTEAILLRMRRAYGGRLRAAEQARVDLLLHRGGGRTDGEEEDAVEDDHRHQSPTDALLQPRKFYAKYSAHAEPRAAQLVLRDLVERHGLPNGARVALVTDHRAIVLAQKHLNGFGGIGHGYALNKLYQYAYDLWYERGIDVVFFYIEGKRNPADSLSRHFGAEEHSGSLQVRQVDGIGLPFLRSTECPLCEEGKED